MPMRQSAVHYYYGTKTSGIFESCDCLVGVIASSPRARARASAAVGERSATPRCDGSVAQRPPPTAAAACTSRPPRLGLRLPPSQGSSSAARQAARNPSLRAQLAQRCQIGAAMARKICAGELADGAQLSRHPFPPLRLRRHVVHAGVARGRARPCARAMAPTA
eukprot:3251445-Pleurochrysis_carterae.AAC.4